MFTETLLMNLGQELENYADLLKLHLRVINLPKVTLHDKQMQLNSTKQTVV